MSAALEFAPFLKAFANLGLEAMAMDIERGKAKEVVARAKEIVHVSSSETRDSIAIQGEGMDAKGPWIDVGSKLEKAFYEEFGSVHGPAVAFLRRALFEVMGGSGKAHGVSWTQMHRPKHSRNRPRGKSSKE